MPVYVKIKVTPGSKKEVVTKNGIDNYLISVKEKREENKANIRALAIVASLYGVRTDDVRIVKGHHQSGKLLIINN